MQSKLADIRSRRFGLALAVLVLTSLLLPASVLARDDEASEGESDEQSKASEEEETKEPEPEPDADDRGNRKRRWPVEQVIGRGHGLATAYYGQIFPDMPAWRVPRTVFVSFSRRSGTSIGPAARGARSAHRQRPCHRDGPLAPGPGKISHLRPTATGRWTLAGRCRTL